jgi:hypothetical protein
MGMRQGVSCFPPHRIWKYRHQALIFSAKLRLVASGDGKDSFDEWLRNVRRSVKILSWQRKTYVP